MTEQWTIGRLLTWTTDYLRDHGSESPRLDAEVLLAHARDCPRIALYTSFQEEAPPELRDSFRELVRRRAAGEPVAYLVQEKEFYSLPFFVDSRVLIPRPDTEQLIVASLDLLAARPAPDTRWAICDVGTGSGAIAITLAKHLPQAQVTAVDVSPDALEVARENARRLEVDNRVTFSVSDLLEAVSETPQFDLIVSNPPYVSEPEYAELPRDIKQHEPRLALVGGPSGLEVSHRLITQARTRLNPAGWLLLETSPMLAEQLAEHFRQCGFVDVDVQKDLGGLLRVVRGRVA